MTKLQRLSIVLALAVGANLLTACTMEPEARPSSIPVHAGEAVTLKTEDGVTVELKADSFTGDGTLSVTPLNDEKDVNAWDIELSGGATLVGEAVLRFDSDVAQPQGVAPLITSAEDGVVPVAFNEVAVDGSSAVVVTTHFSTWRVMWFEDLMDNLRSELDRMYASAGKQPVCEGENEVREQGYVVGSDTGARVKWCFGLKDGARGGEQPRSRLHQRRTRRLRFAHRRAGQRDAVHGGQRREPHRSR
jgi:hypothetical protein